MNSRFSLAHALSRDEAPSAFAYASGRAVPTLDWPVNREPARLYRWFFSRLLERIARLGLTVEVRHDFDAFVAARMPGYHEAINPAFDPRYSRLRPDRSFWLEVADERGEMVACIAAKMMRLANLYPAIADLSVWYDNDPTLPHEGEWVEMLSDTSRRIGGTLSTTGRLWTHPEWRNQGLSSYLPLLARTMMLARHNVDYHFGFANAELVEKGVPFLRYGFPRAEPCMRVKLMGEERVVDLHIVWMSQAELVADVEDCVAYA